MKIKDILREKGTTVHTIGSGRLISEAVRQLNKYHIGALVVVDEKEAIKGIITERDILRLCETRAGALGHITVGQEMTRDVLIGVPDDDLNYVMNVMIENHIRHIPIMSENRLAGIISVGDVLKARLDQCEFHARHLHDYITGKYPG